MEISRQVWQAKYRRGDARGVPEPGLADTWRRVARALAAPEGDAAPAWEQRFYALLEDFKFLPGGRILAGAGTGQHVTLFNCFVMGVIDDSLDGIFDGLKEGALTMQRGGGVGYDFSTLRPAGTSAHATGAIASGPVSFMRIWDAMCATILSTGARRGAMMATLRCDHPDIELFVRAKATPGELRHFNLSVLISDDFMQAVRGQGTWDLVFPIARPAGRAAAGEGQIVERRWSGAPGPVPCRVHRTVEARALWELILRSTYEQAEPGVLFIDRMNRRNNLWYREHLSATNPCGEIPLPPYGACNLGSINLTRFVLDPFQPSARLDEEGIEAAASTAVRLLDNVVDVSEFPLPRQAEMARGTRRLGLGVTGLADALILLGLDYGEEPARRLASRALERICHAAYRTSIALAREKGPFPFLEPDRYLEGEFVRSLPADIREGIAASGIRNSHLTAIAPTGTISLFAGNVSSGIEPVFAARHRRRMLDPDQAFREFTLTDWAVALWQEQGRGGLPPAFVEAGDLAPEAHLLMQAALQPHVDSAISKTINIPRDYPFEDFRAVYDRANALELKGCTTFRPNAVTGTILEEESAASACCTPEREAD